MIEYLIRYFILNAVSSSPVLLISDMNFIDIGKYGKTTGLVLNRNMRRRRGYIIELIITLRVRRLQY